VFLVSLVIYWLTLAPTVTLVDSGELIVAARFLGVAHPPGFPLYLILAHLFSVIPIGSIAFRINFASAFFAALASGLLTLVTAELIASASCFTEGKVKKGNRKLARAAKDDSGGKSGWILNIFPAAISGLLLAFSRTLWSYATIAEVYTLNTLLIVTILFLMARWRRRILEDPRWIAKQGKSGKPTVTAHDRPLYAAAVTFGLALGVHHVTVGLLLPALAAIVYRTQGFEFFKSRRLIYAALVSLCALFAVNSYLPLAASANPILNWGDPRSLQTIWWHITGRQYQVFFSFTPAILGEEFRKFVDLLLSEFGHPWLPLVLVCALFGYFSAFRRDRTTFWLLVLIVVFNLAYTLCYDIAEDKDAYHLPVFVTVAIACGLGLREILQLFPAKIRSPVAPIFLVLPILTLVANWPYNNRSRYFIAHDYVENIQSTIESNSLLLTLEWQVASPMLYTREIEQRRRDIKAIDVQLLRRSWYFDYLRRSYPDLIARSGDKVDTYVAELRKWEQDPEVYAHNTVLTTRIENAFQQMLQSFVNRELEIAPVYVTAELILTKEGQNVNFIAWLTQNFQAVPRGLVFQLTRDNEFHDPDAPRLQTRGLTDGTIRFADDDVVKLKVLPIYKVMLQSRGQYLAHFHQPERAAAAFEEAKRFE
jgi:transmembrane protein TMEM260 (protein O-mannosyltransferase)